MSRNWKVTHPDHKPFLTNSMHRAFARAFEWGSGSQIKEA